MVKKRGRPLEWPEPWKDLCAKVGGPVSLRESMGYSSPNTLPDKIFKRSPWSKADLMLLGYLCADRGFDFARLGL